jgi:hypothetical protein
MLLAITSYRFNVPKLAENFAEAEIGGPLDFANNADARVQARYFLQLVIRMLMG